MMNWTPRVRSDSRVESFQGVGLRSLLTQKDRELHKSLAIVWPDRDGSALRSLPYGDAHNAIVVAFTQWLNADCGGGKGPFMSISDYGPVDCRTAEYNQDAPNANIFMFRDDTWPYENAIDTLALTTLIFNADNGEIYDADVEVNTAPPEKQPPGVPQPPPARWSTTDPGPTDIDFNSVITHEIGHFLGLSHSDVLGSTMRPSYAAGQTAMASIEQDDVDGVCTALPPNRYISSHDCDPRHGFSGECAVAQNTCALSPGSPGGFGTPPVHTHIFRREILDRGEHP